ncbi:MAG: NifU family protein [Oligoflexia bacterium]|nr:NifU family protein [Oligoflexia bacterium]
MLAKVNEIIESDIRPMLLGDGGDIQVIDLRDDGFLELRVSGQCVHCASLPLTMTFAIEERLKTAFPEIKGVVQLKDLDDEGELVGEQALDDVVGKTCH